MKKKKLILLGALSVLLISCGNPENPIDTTADSEDSIILNHTVINPDSVILSFVYVGCNRINDGSASTTNTNVLRRTFIEVANLERTPAYFFFLGDLIQGKDSNSVNTELDAWLELYRDPTFSGIQDSLSNIELVAVPGNHEMLWKDHSNDVEYTLDGTTQSWMDRMGDFMPENRDHISNVNGDSLDQRMTFSFRHGNVGFIVMNTDTYNANDPNNPKGAEGNIPLAWITSKVAQYKQNDTIDHIFVLGHKPAYVSGEFGAPHITFPDGEQLWDTLMDNSVVAMLSAHDHTYSRCQPRDTGTYQIIAGNGGSDLVDNAGIDFFGYSIINIKYNGEIEQISMGFPVDQSDYPTVLVPLTTTRDSTILTWEANPPYNTK